MYNYYDHAEERWVQAQGHEMTLGERLQRDALVQRLPEPPMLQKDIARAHSLLSEMMARVSNSINNTI